MPEDYVEKIINSITSAATGIDGISIQVLKIGLHFLIYPITHIINHSIKHSTFPSLWKLAEVIPVPKLINPETYKDLRPISILAALSKILEKIIYR